jgi:hypothetical protein
MLGEKSKKRIGNGRKSEHPQWAQTAHTIFRYVGLGRLPASPSLKSPQAGNGPLYVAVKINWVRMLHDTFH